MSETIREIRAELEADFARMGLAPTPGELDEMAAEAAGDLLSGADFDEAAGWPGAFDEELDAVRWALVDLAHAAGREADERAGELRRKGGAL